MVAPGSRRELHRAASLETLGHLDIRSGLLIAFDCGSMDAWADAPQAARESVAAGAYELEHDGVGAAAIPHLPPGRCPVNGIRIDDGEFVVDPKSREVRVNPESPDVPLLDLMCVA